MDFDKLFRLKGSGESLQGWMAPSDNQGASD